jgi:hypothetical protein
MEQLHQWLEAQFAERKTEPNSGLGKAITYLLRHRKALTLFLRKAGTPLDNNLVERALKRAVLHRKNALFYHAVMHPFFTAYLAETDHIRPGYRQRQFLHPGRVRGPASPPATP